MSTWILEAEIAVVLAAGLLPVALFPLVYRHYRRFGLFAGWPALLTLATFAYVCGLIAFTLFPLPDANDTFCTVREEISFWQLTPFASVGVVLDQVRAVGIRATLTSEVFLQVAFNVVLLIPLGALLAHRYRRGFGFTVAAGLLTSLLIESTQGTGIWGLYGCPYRLADVDDLITNTAGAAIGWLIGMALTPILPDPAPEPDPDLAEPTVRRRLGATVLDYLAVIIVGTVAQVALIVSARVAIGPDYADAGWFGSVGILVGTVVPVVVLMGVLPLVRRDAAGPGQITTWLAVRSGDGRRARSRSLVRFGVRWVPLLLLAWWQPMLAIALVAVIELGTVVVRRDRRSASGAIARTTTVTRRSLDE